MRHRCGWSLRLGVAVLAGLATAAALAATLPPPSQQLDGTWSAEFTVETSSVGLAQPGQVLTGLSFKVSGSQITGDFAGTINLTPTLMDGSYVYFANVTSSVLGADAACSGDLYFVAEGSTYVGTEYTDSITCRGGTIEGSVDGYRELGTGPATTTEPTPATTEPETTTPSGEASRGMWTSSGTAPATIYRNVQVTRTSCPKTLCSQATKSTTGRTTLKLNDTLSTSSASALVAFPDGSDIKIAPSTQLQVSQDADGTPFVFQIKGSATYDLHFPIDFAGDQMGVRAQGSSHFFDTIRKHSETIKVLSGVVTVRKTKHGSFTLVKPNTQVVAHF